MVDVIQFLVTVLVQMDFTDKVVKNRAHTLLLERTVGSRVNVQERTLRGAMKLPENAVASPVTTVITASGCVPRDCLVPDAP